MSRARRRRNLSQVELAELVGVASSHLSKMEAGQRRLSVELLGRLFRALEIPLADVVRILDLAAEASDGAAG